ncbi:MAG: hypothetical protein N3A69_15885, partial [Leptospiraceae bacterium]|nr:hypothetical protein [Leptospiraceae bacterium]
FIVGYILAPFLISRPLGRVQQIIESLPLALLVAGWAGFFIGLIFGTVISVIAFAFMTIGLVSNKEEPQTSGERIGYITIGFLLMLLGAWLASLSKILLYLYLFALLSLPFVIFIYGIYRLKNGRETIYVAKGEAE